jgi:hypothetical protein
MSGSKLGARVAKAVTEFAVIVVGVLSALAVDEWRESSRDEVLRTQYVAGLIEDIELELTYFDLLHDLSRDRMASADRVLLFLGHSAGPSSEALGYEAPTEFDRVALAGDLASAAQLQFFVPEAVVWEDLVETGNLRLLNDLEVRRRVSRYYSQIRFQSRDLDHLRGRFEFLEQYLRDAGLAVTSPVSVQLRIAELRGLPELAAFLRDARHTQAVVLSRHVQLRSWADSALVQLRR